MEIVVNTKINDDNVVEYFITVLDVKNVVHNTFANNVKDRDKIVWELAETYNITEIEMKEEVKEFKLQEIPTIPVIDEVQVDEWFEENQEMVHDRIVTAVKEAVKLNRNVIRLFELSGSGVFITSNKRDWISGLEKALGYYQGIENYEKCATIKMLINKLHEKNKNKGTTPVSD